ncbi:MAG: alpha/beta hydrolase [Gemmatimonadaceae bacterium]
MAQRVDCGWLTVPESRSATTGKHLRLWVAIARAPIGTRRADAILYLHGGPGIGTVDTWFPFFPDGVAWRAFRETRDIVFFDQRGTGRSQPVLCPSLAADLAQVERTATNPSPRLEATVAAYAKCRQALVSNGVSLSAYRSQETVEDAEDLRVALGVPAWNIYGTSYGSFVALQYLRAHPASIRAEILDSPYPPNAATWAEQVTTTARAYEALERACHRSNDCASRFPDIRARLIEAVKRLDAHPIPRPEGAINGGVFVGALWPMLVRTRSALFVPLAIDLAASGDDATVRRLVSIYGGGGSFGDYSHAQAMAINCHEGGRTTLPTREALLRYPYLAGNDLAEGVDRICAAFQPVLAAPSQFAPVASDKPVLVYSGEFDPATPTEDVWNTTRFLARSTVVQVPGASHSPFYTDACTRGIAHAFLSAPDSAPDTRCLEKRVLAAFPLQGMDAFLKSLEEKK